jgi:hydrogenase nickel incorporation protein HypB
MCATCGCDGAGPRLTPLGIPDPDHGHGHHHGHGHERLGRTVVLEERVLARNDELAAQNRHDLAGRGIVAVNLMSSPGSGKTTLLERTVRELSAGQKGTQRPIAVVEGDQETLLDAERIRATGCPVVQINTGEGCHLDAAMLRRGVAELAPEAGSLLFVENVGNLVCPALFDLGETARVVVMSTPEGADKPAKYPHMFRTADLVLVNKVDLLPYVEFDPQRCADGIRRVNPGARVLLVSATSGTGLADWYRWLAALSVGGPRSSGD